MLPQEDISNEADRTGLQEIKPSKILWKTFVLAALLISLLLISVFAHKYTRFPGDLFLSLHIQAFDYSFVKQFMKVVSQIGGGQIATILLLIAAILLWVKHRRFDSLLLIGAGVLSSTDRLLKILVDRPRPSPDLVSVIDLNHSGSFPSGHATFAMTFFGALFYFSSIYINRPLLKRLIQIGSVAIILLTGISRIYLGAHWPSDVLGGYLLGGLILAILVLLHRKARSVMY
jgi:membrane-associated phospholipid phosphatase